jgi:translation initiation factor 2B subunit (eIF-2B alpha/beta/delta family)
LFQGHITARALAKAGIPCTLIVDNAANIFLKEANLLLTGADAIDAHGNVYNKVGTSLISLATKRHGVPHFVATISSTFDPLTFFGLAEPIEERKPKEVWRERLALVSERNPAFDKTPASQIRAIVSEKGVLRPKLFAKRMVSAMRLKGRNKKDFELHLLLK